MHIIHNKKTNEVMLMSKPLIMVTSITYAMKGREILRKNGFRATLTRTPKGENSGSCGYSIYVPQRTGEAERLLIRKGIKVIGRTTKGDLR